MVYAKKMASQYKRYGCKEPKPRTPKEVTNVIHFLDISASEGEETLESSSTKVSMKEAITN